MIIRFFFLMMLVVGFVQSDNVSIENRHNAPQTIKTFEKEYKLAWSAINKNISSYEYTSGDETVDNWKTFVTLTYFETKLTPLQYANFHQNVVGSKQGVPYYNISLDNNHVYSMAIFEPSQAHQNFEYEVTKSYHLDKCNKTVVLHYAVREPSFGIKTEEQKKKKLTQLISQIKNNLEAIKQDGFTPLCEN